MGESANLISDEERNDDRMRVARDYVFTGLPAEQVIVGLYLNASGVGVGVIEDALGSGGGFLKVRLKICFAKYEK